ncbi:unnamed protein product [Clavelina lepadiformis]|uniref:Tetraspanin n=1 Tax=Clavelina lepadiformis TaxID=159417 RepID=A0ABP0GK83_CLALP
MAGVAMFTGGLLLEYTDVGKSILMTLSPTITSSQLGAVGVALVALGAFVILVSFVGCCGAVSESRGMLGLYFVALLFLLLGQVAVTVVAFVYGYQGFATDIDTQLTTYIVGNGTVGSEQAVLDTVQQFFQCCGSNGINDYEKFYPVRNETVVVPVSTSINATNAPATYFNHTWPDSCCISVGKSYKDLIMCKNVSLPKSTLTNYVNTEGCTLEIQKFVKDNLLIIGVAAAGIALIEVIAMITSCSLRKELD